MKAKHNIPLNHGSLYELINNYLIETYHLSYSRWYVEGESVRLTTYDSKEDLLADLNGEEAESLRKEMVRYE